MLSSCFMAPLGAARAGTATSKAILDSLERLGKRLAKCHEQDVGGDLPVTTWKSGEAERLIKAVRRVHVLRRVEKKGVRAVLLCEAHASFNENSPQSASLVIRPYREHPNLDFAGLQSFGHRRSEVVHISNASDDFVSSPGNVYLRCGSAPSYVTEVGGVSVVELFAQELAICAYDNCSSRFVIGGNHELDGNFKVVGHQSAFQSRLVGKTSEQ